LSATAVPCCPVPCRAVPCRAVPGEGEVADDLVVEAFGARAVVVRRLRSAVVHVAEEGAGELVGGEQVPRQPLTTNAGPAVTDADVGQCGDPVLFALRPPPSASLSCGYSGTVGEWLQNGKNALVGDWGT
jgi:hypothetical protein